MPLAKPVDVRLWPDQQEKLRAAVKAGHAESVCQLIRRIIDRHFRIARKA